MPFQLVFKRFFKRKNTGKLLQFAPGFLENQRSLAPLIYSSEETETASGFESLFSEEATAQTFLAKAEKASLLHLSTHASAGENPQIEFFDRPVSLDEIYALRLPTELVVLSACESGLGAIAKGEGIMSLARGFTYAGAESLVASLWQVNEQSTASVFKDFYKKLFSDKTTSEALHEAKNAYLNSEIPNAKKSPYYWAGFTFYGKDGQITQPKTGLFFPIVFAGLLILGFFSFRKFRA